MVATCKAPRSGELPSGARMGSERSAMVDETSHTSASAGAGGHRHEPRVTVTAQYDHPSAARDAAEALHGAGFGSDDVSLVAGASDDVLRAQRQADPNVIERGEVPPANGAVLGFVAGMLGCGFLGLLMGSGLVDLFGKEQAQAVGPFWAAVIGGGVFGLAFALAGFIFNSPLPHPEPPEHPSGTPDTRTFVSVYTNTEKQADASSALERFEPSSLSVWHADNGDWLPQGR